MSRLLFVVSFLICCYQHAYPQDSIRRPAILISPALLTPRNFALQAGFLYPLNRGWAFLAEGAIPPFRANQSAYTNVATWRASVELKRYRQHAKRKGVYYSFQTAYLFRNLEEGRGKIKRQNGTWFTYDAATLRSPVLSMAVKVGREFTSERRNRLTDLFVGVGFRRLFNRHQLQNAAIASNADVLPDRFGWIHPAQGWRYAYPITRFHFTIGFRVGFKL